MAIYVYRQGVSQKGYMPHDETASTPDITLSGDQVSLHWESGDGRRSRFMVIFTKESIAELAHKCNQAILRTQPEQQKELKDYTTDELLEAVKNAIASED